MTAPRKPILTEEEIKEAAMVHGWDFGGPAATHEREGFKAGARFALASAAKVAEEREGLWREWMVHLDKISIPSDDNCVECDRFRIALGIDKEGA